MLIAATQSQIPVTLSREELVVILKLLKAREIAGINFSDLQSGSDRQLSEEALNLVNTAVKALVARGYLTPLQAESDKPLKFASPQEVQRQKWTRFSVQPEVLALVGACAFPAKSLLLTWRKAGGTDILYVHERAGLVVVNTSSLPDIYTFTALEDWKAALDLIMDTLAIKEQQASIQLLPEAWLRLEVLANIRNELDENETYQLLYQLTEGGLPISTAQVFLETIRQTRVVAGITMIHKDDDARDDWKGSRLSILITEQTCFVLEPDEAEKESVKVCQASAKVVREKICAIRSECNPVATDIADKKAENR